MRIMDLLSPATSEVESRVLELASRRDRFESAKGRKLLELVRFLEARRPAPTAFAWMLDQELWLQPEGPGGVVVKVCIDWQDRAPLRDGLPEMHYRTQIYRRSSELSRDERVSGPDEVEKILWKSFGWSR